ncbi:hypothetical protein ABEB36_014142 [Hypothenemus hampei]|uniref:Myb-like domain-containing protein n=1 Tax=Hypothenemus hampei TaxID=57062 RepID=A0ABD1E3L8_HYPHA
MEKNNILIPVEWVREGRRYSLNLNENEIIRMENDPIFFDEIVNKYASLREEDETLVQKYNDQEDTKVENLWKDNEIKLLISLYGEHLTDFKTAKKKQMWDIIAEKMQSQGYNRSAQKCQRKWINMTRTYRPVKDNRGPKSSGRGKATVEDSSLQHSATSTATYKYFESLDDILGVCPSNSTDTFTVSMGCSYENIESQNIDQMELNETNENSVEQEEVQRENLNVQNENTMPNLTVSNNNLKRKRKNYTQEYYKARIEYIKNEKIETKERRYKERMELEEKRLKLEERKIILLENIFEKLERNK